MILWGRSIVDGVADGEVVKFEKPIVILGDVDERRGTILGRDVKDKIVVFPRGAGSTVGSYTIYGLVYYKNAPKAFILEEAETIVAAGAIIAEIPTVDRIDISKIEDGSRVRVEGDKVIL
jgi:predicted aconitase with swiveling domain